MLTVAVPLAMQIGLREPADFQADRRPPRGP
jgi:hypothetical protein